MNVLSATLTGPQAIRFHETSITCFVYLLCSFLISTFFTECPQYVTYVMGSPGKLGGMLMYNSLLYKAARL